MIIFILGETSLILFFSGALIFVCLFFFFAAFPYFCSRITNKVVMAGDEDETDHGPVANHEEVLDAVNQRASDMQELVKKTVEIIGKEILPTLPDLPLVSLDVPSTISCLLSDKKLLAWSTMLVAGGAFVGMAMSRKR